MPKTAGIGVGNREIAQAVCNIFQASERLSFRITRPHLGHLLELLGILYFDGFAGRADRADPAPPPGS
jgi:hypothetical protein